MNRSAGLTIWESMPQPQTKDRVLAVRGELMKKLGRAPTSTEIRAALPGRNKPTGARIRQIVLAAGLETYKVKPHCAPIDGPIKDGLGAVDRLLVANLRRLYRREIAKPDARSDVQMARDGGFRSESGGAARLFRRHFDGSARCGFGTLERFAKIFGVPVHELLMPTGED